MPFAPWRLCERLDPNVETQGYSLPPRPEHEISIPSHDLGSNKTDRYKDLERGGISREGAKLAMDCESHFRRREEGDSAARNSLR
ncbi:hypothetical protein VN12_26170 [Pirellula sp. SH-Sr6A]|nr:hypothetical protein VN12_26170 [Pirellula sp. SH-Sr6A]